MPREPKRRKWSVALECDEDISADEIAAAIVDAHGINIINIEEIEPMVGEESDDDDDVPNEP